MKHTAILPNAGFTKNRALTSLALSLGLAVATISTPFANAANETWISTSGTNWSTSGNWAPNATLAGSGDVIFFGANPGSGTTLNNDISSLSLAGITFNSGAAAWTLGGNSFTLAGNITNSSTSLQTINNAITTTAVRTVTLTSSGGNITLGGNISGAAGGLTTAGTGTLTLSGNESFTGALTVAANTTVILSGSNGARPAGTNGLTAVTGTLQLKANSGNIVSGTSFALSTERTANSPLTLNNGSILQLRSDSGVTFAGGNTLGGVGTATITFDVNNTTGLAASGTNNTITFAPGGFDVFTTTINVTGSNGYALALGPLNTVVNGAHTDTINPTTANVTIGGYTSNATGNHTLALTGSTTGNSITGVIANGSGTTLVTKSNSSTWILSGSNTYSGVTTVSAGVLQYQANGTNTVSGTSAAMSPNSQLTVNAGTVQLRADADTTFTTSKFNPNGGTTTTFDVGALSTGSGNTISLRSTNTVLVGGAPNATMTINVTGANGDQFRLSGGNMSFADSGNTLVLNPTTANMTVTNNIVTGINTGHVLKLDGTSSSNIFSGNMSDAAMSLTKSNTSTWTLSGSNTYTGATTISGGTLAITGTQALGGTSLVNIAGGATLGYTGASDTFAKKVTITSGTGTISNTGSGTLGLSDTLTKLDKTLALSGNFNVSGIITGSSGVFDSDLSITSGTTTVSGTNNDYFGATNVSSGATLVNGATNALPTSTVMNLDGTYKLNGFNQTIAGLQTLTGSAGTITNSGTSTLTVNNDSAATSGTTDYTYNGVIADGTGKTSLTKTGNRTLTLTGANTYSGGTTLTYGALVAGNNSALGSGLLTLDGGTLMSGTNSLMLANTIVVNTTGGQVSGSSDLELDGAASGAGILTVNVNATHKVKINPTTDDSFAPGRIDVHSGTLLLGGANKIGNTTNVTLSGGTFATGGNNETVNTLTMSSSSTLDLGSSGTVHFADSSSTSGSWSGTLSIWNWVGNVGGGGTTQLFFGTTSGGLTVGQLGAINIYSDGGATWKGTGSLLTSGELVPIPEPATIFGALALLGLVGYRERKRFSFFMRLCDASALTMTFPFKLHLPPHQDDSSRQHNCAGPQSIARCVAVAESRLRPTRMGLNLESFSRFKP